MNFVFGIWLLAVAGAIRDRVLVRRCVLCGHAHLHYIPVGADTSAIERAPRCAPHRRYLIRIVDVLPPAAIPGQTKRRAA